MPDLERLLAGLCFGEPAASWALMICSRPNASFTALMLAACIDLRSPGILHGQAFTEVTNEAGLNYNQFASLGSNALETFRMTGGVAAIDYDGDGWTDLFVTRMDAPPILFHNRGGVFEAIAAEALGINLPGAT